MSFKNCTVDVNLSGWIFIALGEQIAICVAGAISNLLAILCLVDCQRTGKAVKMQMICIFSLLVIICTLTLPFVTFLYYTHSFCINDKVPAELKFFLSIFNSILLQGERLNFSAMAAFRLMAVSFPNHYQKMVTPRVVMVLQACIFVYVVPPWIVLGFMKNFDFSHNSGTVMRLNVNDKNSHMFKFVTALYGVNYCLPFFVTFVAYTTMMIFIIRQNRAVKIRKTNAHSRDHIASTIRIVILTNLLLDGPHIVVHLLQDAELASIITHMVFFLHIVLDPIIFVIMNQNYRLLLWNKIRKCMPTHCSLHLHASSQTKDIEESMPKKDLRDSWHRLQAIVFQKRNAVYVT